MHLVDVLSRAQEDDDKHLAAWNSFYQGVISMHSSPDNVEEHLSSAIHSKRSSDAEDAKLVFHTLCLLASHYSEKHSISDEQKTNWSFHSLRSGVSSAPVPLLAGGAPVIDRIWNLVKSRSKGLNAFTVSKLAKRVSNVYGKLDEQGSICQNLEFNASAVLEIGRRYATHSWCETPAIVDNCHTKYMNRGEECFPYLNSASIQAQVNALIVKIDEVLSQPITIESLASALFEIVSGLELSVKGDLRISTSRLLIRLTDCFLQQDVLTRTFLLLDDIECAVTSNCSFYDQGMFFHVRSKSLLRLSEFSDENDAEQLVNILVDAYKAAQLAVSAFDKCLSHVDNLVISVQLIIGLCEQLNVEGISNFYTVKLNQILDDDHTMDLRTKLVFPPDSSCDFMPDVFQTGQPKLPAQITLSPRGFRRQSVELAGQILSPQGGRGMQTLLSWGAPNFPDVSN